MLHSYTVQRHPIDSQVCFFRLLFANPVKPLWYIIGPVEPLQSTNQNWWGAKLLPMSVLISPVDCVYLCHLLRTQHHYLCPNGRESPPSAYPLTSTTARLLPPTHPPPYIQHLLDITRVVKNCLKNQQ